MSDLSSSNATQQQTQSQLQQQQQPHSSPSQPLTQSQPLAQTIGDSAQQQQISHTSRPGDTGNTSYKHINNEPVPLENSAQAFSKPSQQTQQEDIADLYECITAISKHISTAQQMVAFFSISSLSIEP